MFGQKMNTPEALKLSKKGVLSYDSSWYKDGRLHETITNCTSPPKLSSEVTLSSSQEYHGSNTENDLRNTSDTRNEKCQRKPIPSLPAKPKTNLRMNQIDDFQTTIGRVEVSIQECQEQWDQLSKERADKRIHQAKEVSNQLLEQAEKSSVIFTEQQDEKTQMLLKNMQHIQKENEEVRLHRLQRQQDRYKWHIKRMEITIKTALQKKAEAEVEAEHNRRVAERQAYLESMMNVHKQIDESSKKVCHQLERYRHKEFLPPDSEIIKKNVEKCTKQAEFLVNDAKLRGASMDLVENMHKIIESLMVCQELASRVIAEADRLVQEDTARKAREAAISQHQAAVAAAALATTHEQKKGESTRLVSSSIKDNGNTVYALQEAISADALQEY